MFDKISYWKNRKAGKRGQGDVIVLSKRDKKLSKPPSTRREQRKKIRDPRHTGKSRPTQRKDK